MVIMDVYYSPDRLQEIWQNIDDLHLSYLEMEESPEKLQHRMRLEDRIREFLCMAAHSQKFYLRETAEVLHRSANSKKDFSGYKAATGWNAIQLYAGNLLSQPWRKEYRQVKTYCGFYKHQIEANLVGAEMMFEAMGYKHHSNGILILEGPICPDTVTNVSRDCLIAYVECQIMKAIWEEVNPAFKIGWQEVLDFRKTHLCTPEHSIRALTYQHHQRQYHAQNSDPYATRCHPNLSPIVSFPPLAAPYAYNGCCANGYATYAYHPVHYAPKPAYANGYCCPNGFAQPVYGYAVPTGQLIEVDAPDRAVAAIGRRKNSTEGRREGEEAHFEDWDYVYRDLESQGYSKDLGERGDLLKQRKPTNLDEAMHNLAVTERPLKIVEALERYDQAKKVVVEKRQSQSSSYENLTEIKKVAKAVNKAKTLPAKEKVGQESKTADKSPNKRKDRWECKACTYLNEHGKDICEMCSKTKGNVEQQMEIGGPHCSKCTLVNAKDTKVCQACGASLKDSPTYI